jgi:hypothetical protein
VDFTESPFHGFTTLCVKLHLWISVLHLPLCSFLLWPLVGLLASTVGSKTSWIHWLKQLIYFLFLLKSRDGRSNCWRRWSYGKFLIVVISSSSFGPFQYSLGQTCSVWWRSYNIQHAIIYVRCIVCNGYNTKVVLFNRKVWILFSWSMDVKIVDGCKKGIVLVVSESKSCS